MTCDQCDQIGLFLKDLGEKFSHKSCANIWQIWAIFWQLSPFKKESCFGYFLGNFYKSWLLFILASGHTGNCFFSSEGKVLLNGIEISSFYVLCVVVAWLLLKCKTTAKMRFKMRLFRLKPMKTMTPFRETEWTKSSNWF